MCKCASRTANVCSHIHNAHEKASQKDKQLSYTEAESVPCEGVERERERARGKEKDEVRVVVYL